MKTLRSHLFVTVVCCLVLGGLNASSAFGDVIIDNGDSGTSSTGSWSVSGGSSPYGSDSLWARDGVTYTWGFDSQPAGTYEVLMWWSGYGSRASNISVDINYNGGSSTTSINQSENAGLWNSLGTYYFDTAGSVTITAANGSTISTCADAVWFRLISQNSSPVAYIDSISPNPADANQPIEFVGHGTDAEGTIIAYRWESNIGGLLSESATFTMPSLDEGAHTISFQVQDNNDTWSQAVTETLIVGQVSVEIIIDNRDGETSSTGTWSISGAADPYGDDSFWSRDGATFSWNFVPIESGDYEVSMYWTEWASRSTAAAVSIEHSGGTASVSVNQQENGSQWNSLDTYSFEAGSSYPVTITAQPGPSSTCADAVKFSLVTSSGNTPPVATIDSIDPNPAELGQPIEFSGHGVDTDGLIIDYRWESNIDGPLSNLDTFTTASLAEGIHTISFQVQDNNDVWSGAVTESLLVGQTPSEIIVDNGDPGTSYAGSWGPSSATGFYGADSLWSRDTNVGYSFEASVQGPSNISLWWTQWSSRSPAVPVQIYDGQTLLDTVTINQQVDGGQWNFIGTYTFTGLARVTIISVDDNYSTCADAVSFSYQSGGNVQPAATIDSMNPNPAEPGQLVSFSGHGTDSDGTIEGYNWRSSVDDFLSDQQTFSRSNLSQGTHTIYFRVQDDLGIWSQEVSDVLQIGGDLEENIYACFGYGPEDSRYVLTAWLQSIGATQQGDTWTYINNSLNKTFVVHISNDVESMKQVLQTAGAHILFYGHSNYGLGPVFATGDELYNQMIPDIDSIDDDRILNISSPWIHLSVSGMRTGQAYPYWWPVFQDGTSAIMPYDFGDPRGDPPYNYYLTYQIPGDPTHYKVETVNNGAIERFTDSRSDAWYSEDGSGPDPNDPNHLKYYITNPAPWSPSCIVTGNWLQYQNLPANQDSSRYYRENYITNAAGSGNDRVTWYFTIPEAGEYKVLSWWPGLQGHSGDAPYTINHDSGSTTVRVNQGINGQQWNQIGQFHFDANDYTVVLTDDASSGSVVADGLRISHVDNPPEVIAADFSSDVRIGVAPLVVTFWNSSKGDLTGRVWNFGDGLSNSTRDYIDHQYTSPGTYTVSLTVSGPMGGDTKTRVGYIVVGATQPEETLYADFSTWGNTGTVPLRVYFSDRSTGDLREGITYTPNGSFTGVDGFAYTVADDEGNISNQGIVTITVSDSPVARDDSAITAEGVAVKIDVLDNDEGTDSNIDPSTLTITAPPNNGAVEVNDVDEIVMYTPSGGFVGEDTFAYTVDADDGDTSNQAVVTIKVGNSPVAFDDFVITGENDAIEIDVADNDIDPDGSIDASTLVVTSPASDGVAEVNAVEGTITYTPNGGFVGEDTFAYTVEDNDSVVSNAATVTVIVGDAPVAVEDSIATGVGMPITIDILDNDEDSDGSVDPGTIAVTNTPDNGGYQVHDCWLWSFGDGSTSHERSPRYTYNQTGNYTVRLTVTDVGGNTSTETKESYVRTLVWDKSIDNVDYPKTHYSRKTLVYRKELEIDPANLRYGRMFYLSCDSGNYFIDTLNRGILFYTLNTTGMEGGTGFSLYLREYFQGRSDEQIWATLQSNDPVFDFYDFSKVPPVLQSQSASALQSASISTVSLDTSAADYSLSPRQEEIMTELGNLTLTEAFEKLKDGEFLVNEDFLRYAISTTFKDIKTEAIGVALKSIKLPVVETINGKVVNRWGDLRVAKEIVQVFFDEAVDGLLELYSSGDVVAKKNIISVLGEMAPASNRAKDVLVEALGDKTVYEENDPEVSGVFLRICDLAYNQLVLSFEIKDVLRMIGTGHKIELRDYHIELLKGRL